MTQSQKNQRLADKRDYLATLQERRDINNSRIAEVTQAIADLEATNVSDAIEAAV